MMKRMMTGAVCLGLLAMSSQAYAGQAIPEESGFSGFVQLGVGIVSMESNTVAGASSVGTLGERTLSSLQESPDSETKVYAVFNGELKYTFGASKTQLFFGNSLEDLVRYDFTSQIGVRQDVGKAGIMGGGILFTSFPTEVWKDPYMTDTRRQRTDRSSQGIRFAWENIMSSRFDVQYSYREISIDKEYSGNDYFGTGPITAYQRSLLDREGDQYTLAGEYTFVLDKQNLLKPKVTINSYDLDGEAMASDEIGVQLTHTYLGERYVFISNIYLSTSENDKRNPLFNKTQEDDTIGLGFIAIYQKLMEIPELSLVGNVAYYTTDSNIAFYDTTVFVSSVSCLYRF